MTWWPWASKRGSEPASTGPQPTQPTRPTAPLRSQPPAAALRRAHGRRGGIWIMPWPLALAIVVALHLVSAWFVLKLSLNNAPEVYYRADSPAVVLRDALRRDFPNDEVLTAVFQGPDLYGPDTLARLDRLASALERHPLVDRVTTVLSLERIAGTADGFSVEPLVDPAALGKTGREQIRQRVHEDRFAPGALASRDGTVLALAVRPRPLTESAERLQLKVAVAAAINDAGLRSYYAGDAGPVTIDVAQLTSMLDDTKVFVPVTAAIGLLLLGWVVGRLRPVLIGAVALSTVILPVLAGVAAAGQPYTMATAILPSLLAAYTMATLLHLYAGVQRAHAARMARGESLRRALAETVRPGAYNVLTTGAGLLSLVLVPIPPVQVFGIGGAAGTALVFLTVYFLVPPFLLRGERRRWPGHGSTMGRLGRLAARAAIFSMRRPRLVVGGAAVLAIAALPLLTLVEVESDVLTFFAPDHPVNRDTRLVETKLAGVTSLEISLRADERDGLQSVATVQAVKRLQDWLEAQPEVDRATSMVDLIEEMHWAMNDEQPAFRALPPDDPLLSQYLLVYDGQDLYELVNRDFDHARILLNLNVHGAKQIGQAIDRIRARVQAEPLPALSVDVGGYGRLFADQVDLLVSGQLRSFAGAFTQIFLLMALLWRSFSASAACMVPNLAPLFFIFAMMGAAGIHLDLATVMIAGVILGITVDDTIHLYHGYRERQARGMAPAMAIVRSYQGAGRAVLATTVLLTAQFGLLATSAFIPTANFGLMTAVGLLAGQAAELVMLPAMLVLLHARRRGARWGDLLARSPPSRTGPTVDTGWAPTMLIERPARDAATAVGADGDAVPDHDAVRVGAPQPGHAAAAASAGPDTAEPGPARPRADGVGSNGRDAEVVGRRILVCQDKACLAAGAAELWRELAATARANNANASLPPVQLVATGCLGACEHAPVVQPVGPPLALAACGIDERVGRILAGALQGDQTGNTSDGMAGPAR